MAQTVLITLTLAGTDTGPFNLYSDSDGYFIPFESGVSKTSLLAGYTSVLVPDLATIIRVRSTSVLCENYVDLTIVTSTTTTTSTSSTSTTSTTTTASCANFELDGGSGGGRTFSYTRCDGGHSDTFVPAGDTISECIRLPYFAAGATNTGPCA